jgi:hypothetical protein
VHLLHAHAVARLALRQAPRGTPAYSMHQHAPAHCANDPRAAELDDSDIPSCCAVQQNWIHVAFLALGFVVTWAAWVLFGAFATVRMVVVDFCQNGEDLLAQRAGAQARL